MGLAASQARFLGITARKNSCELRAMQIAQEKLSISNQLTSISEDYQKSLDATKLVWDSEFITDNSIYDVSYELLMRPSLLNNYSPQLLANLKGQIVLDSQYANIMKNIANLGNNQTGGATRNKTQFKDFLAAMNRGGVISKLDYDNMITALNGSAGDKFYDPLNGLGSDIKEKYTTNSMNLPTLKTYIKSLTNPSSNYLNDLRASYGSDPATPTIYDKAAGLGNLLNFKNYDGSGFNAEHNSLGKTWADDTTNKLSISDANFNFADLLDKEVTLSSDDQGQFSNALNTFINYMYQIMTNFFEIDPASVDQEYLDFAMSQICSLNNLTWNSQTHSSSGTVSGYSTGDPASSHTCAIQNGSSYQVSLSNLVRGLITYFEVAVEGYNSGYNVNSTGSKSVQDSYYVTKDPDYYYFIKNPEAIAIDDNTQLLLDYYSQMFNQICANGWTENTNVSDPDSLKNMLKNGTLFTSTISEMDGQFYQGPYTSNNFIAEVADEDAITRAEAEYKTQQLKLSAKEEELNLDMQMVDAELSALTTEYDTVKSMISKSVEKGFSTLGG